MESRFNGVPISATQMGPEGSSSFRGIAIKAPITVDESDFDISFSSPRNSTTSSYYSGSDLESEVYESKVETHLVDESAVSAHSLRSPDEEIGQESVGVDKNDAFRPFVRIPDGKMYKGSSVVDDSDDSGSFLSDSGDELVKDEIFIANLGDSRPLVDVVEKLHVPIALISADSDDDSQISGVSEEEGFSGIVRVPIVEILRRVDSAPKVRVLESGGDEKIVDTEFVDGLVNIDDVLASLEEMEDLDVKSSVNSSLSVYLGPDKGVDIGEEEFCSTLNSGMNGDLLDLGVEIQELGVIDEGNRSETAESENEDKIVTTVESFSSNASADLVPDKCVDIGEEDTANSLVVDEEFDSILDSRDLGVEIQELGVIYEGNPSEKVESENEDKIVTTVESFSSNVSGDLVPDKCVDIGEEDTAKSLVVDEEFDSTLDSGGNGDNLHLGLEIQDEGNRSEKVENENEDKIVTTVESFSSNVSADLVLDKCVDIGEEDTTNSLVVDEELDSTLESGENGDNLGLEIQDEGNRSEKVENENEHKVISTDESFSSNAGGEIGFVQQCTSDSQDSSLTSVIDAGESLSECSGSGNETRKEAVNWVPDSASFSNGEILSRYSQEIGGEFEEVSSETKNKIEQNYMRLVQRLGCSSVDSEDLYHLILSDDQKSVSLAETDDLNFSLSILVIGKTGVGKSATINSIFGETKVATNAFEPSIPRVQEIVGAVNGVKLKVFDTPGLKTDQSTNRKILSSIKQAMRKSSPDVILYVDRLDARTSLHDLKSFASHLGPSMWRKSIIVFTHGASIPPDGPHEASVAQKSRDVRQAIGCSMVPICVVENHPLLPNGERWRSEFLLLCCSMKILSDNVVPDVDSDQETRAPPSFRRRSLSGWDRTGNADHYPAGVTVQFSKNATAAFDDHLRVGTRCSDVRVAAALWLVPIVRAVFEKIFGQSGEGCST